MLDKKDMFLKAIRDKVVAAPISPKFKISKWNNKWGKIKNPSKKDKNIYEAGIIFDSLLSEIRSELEILYKKRPKISDEKLIELYFAISNRDRLIVSNFKATDYQNKNSLFSFTLNNNKAKTEVTLHEIAEGCVDGLNKAIFFSKKRIDSDEKPKISNYPYTVLKFIEVEAYLSQIYDVYESYWQGLIWGDYVLNKIPSDDRVFCVHQNNSKFERGAVVSQIRKHRLSAQMAGLSRNQTFLNKFSSDSFITITKKRRKKTISCKRVSSANSVIKHFNSNWRSSEAMLQEEFPKKYLYEKLNSKFSISEALNILRCLSLLAIQYQDRYPKETSYFNVQKLTEFCPKLNKNNLLKALSKATGYEFCIVSEILKFIEFEAKSDRDLWCHPLILIENKYLLLTSSLVTPVINRIVEHWIILLHGSIDEKGLSYENEVLSIINKSITENKTISNYDKAVSRRIKLETGEEEIDLLLRLGKVVIIGETKSIVTTDSPISQYRTVETLKKAAEQANRKLDFIKNNTQSIFKRLDWEYDENINYVFINCIINSGRMFVGLCINKVPIIDEKIIDSYFSDNTIPCISTIDPKGDVMHLAWYLLYSNFEELQSNIKKYLKHPPQINFSLGSVEHKLIDMPTINKDSKKIVYDRLVHQDIKPKKLLKEVQKFQLFTVNNIDEEIAKLDITI